MTDIRSSVIIDRPAAEVFEFVADMAHNPKWQKGQVSCVWTSPPPLAVGSTYDQEARFAGSTIRTSFEVTEFEPGRRIRIVSTSGPMPIDVTRTVDPVGEDRCEVAAHVQGEPPGVMRLFGGMVDKMVKRNVDADYTRLKALLEQ